MKLRIKPWSLIWRFLVTLLVIYALIFVCCINIFINLYTGKLVAWDFRQPLLISIIFIVSVISFIPTLKNNYYIVESTYFVARKMTKEYEYSYSNIEYIDIEASKKKHKVAFYTKQGKWQFLMCDEKNELIKILQKRCKNALTKEDFLRLHPEER